MTKVTFETATIADAIKKAARVAPSRGEAFDKAAGLVVEVNPDQEPSIVLRATNLDIYYREWIDTVDVEGEATIWRLPAALIASVMATLPIGSGKTVTLEEVKQGHGQHLLLKSGKTKAKFNLMMMDHYPEWDIFDPDDMEIIDDLGGRISMVEWAADKSQVPLCGIYFTGDSLVSTDRYRVARTPLAVPNLPDQDVIVPAGILGSILKQTGEVRIGFTETQMLLMPNETTQLRVVRFAAEYPPRINVIMNPSRTASVEVPKDQLLDIIRRASVFSGDDRMPTIRLFLGSEEVAVMLDNADVGRIADVIDVPGQCAHSRVEMKFTPKFLTDALDKVPNERVTLGYNHETHTPIIYIDGGSGYEAWVVTRSDG